MNTSRDKFRTAYEMSLRLSASPAARYLPENTDTVDELWESREDRRAKERASAAYLNVGVCRLNTAIEDVPCDALHTTWFECAGVVTPVVVWLDLNAVPGFRDLSSALALIKTSGMALFLGVRQLPWRRH